jgi:formylglycine-generating enzyme required for sulfatase activity
MGRKLILPLLFVALLVLLTSGCGPSPTFDPTREVPTARPTAIATRAPTAAATEEPISREPPADASVGDTWTRPADGAAVVYVPAGEFKMGSTRGDDDEQPVHTVALDSFWIDRTEVTNAQYEQCVAAGACRPRPSRGSDTHAWHYGDSAYDDYPAIYVTWYQAETYCGWVRGRLPTEAEWEYAARGPEGRMFPWGDEFDGTRLNYCDSNCERDWADETTDDGYAKTAPVGSFPAGASWCEALDMAGNVWEWVADWYASDYYARSPSQNPTGPTSGEYRVLHSGSWGFDPYYVRSANRDVFIPSNTYGHIGFRCAMSSE